MIPAVIHDHVVTDPSEVQRGRGTDTPPRPGDDRDRSAHLVHDGHHRRPRHGDAKMASWPTSFSRACWQRAAPSSPTSPRMVPSSVRCDDSGSMQVYRLSSAGGELIQLTFLDEPVSAARY